MIFGFLIIVKNHTMSDIHLFANFSYASNWYPFVQISSQEIALGFKKVGDSGVYIVL